MAGSSAFGGVRQAAGVSRFSAGQYTTGGVSANAAGSRPSARSAMREPGSPYATAAGLAVSAPATHHVLIVLVLVEAMLLVGLRTGFRNYHGG